MGLTFYSHTTISLFFNNSDYSQVGSIHFIRFPTAQMGAFAALAKEKTMARLASTLCATGGGAFKYQVNIYLLLNGQMFLRET